MKKSVNQSLMIIETNKEKEFLKVLFGICQKSFIIPHENIIQVLDIFFSIIHLSSHIYV